MLLVNGKPHNVKGQLIHGLKSIYRIRFWEIPALSET